MSNSKDIIVVGLQPWDITIGSNCKNLAFEMSKNHRVLYVNAPLDRISSIRKKDDQLVKNRKEAIKNPDKSITEISKNFWVFNPPVIIESIHWLPSPFFTVLNKYNNQVFCNAILNACKKMNFGKDVLFIDSDIHRSFHLPELIEPKVSIYYSRDNLMTVPYWRKHGEKMEPMLMKKVDVVMTNSTALRDMAKEHNSNSIYIGQGADQELFDYSKSTAHEELGRFHKPIIGYVGLISSRRLDYQLIVSIAKNHPDCDVVLVGPLEKPEDEVVFSSADNIHLLGRKPEAELPNFISGFDICINPQINNELTKTNYPRKIDEYLLMGKPVVCTHTPSMEMFEKHVYLANTHEEYSQCIKKALEESEANIAQERVAFAQTHSWENSANKIFDSIDQLENVSA